VSENAKINVATGFNGGVSVSLRADSAAEFEALLADAKSSGTLSALLAQLPAPGAAGQDAAAAILAIQQAIPGTTVLSQPQSTVGQPLPQPQAQPATSQSPPGVTYPGDCPHGVRTYKDSIARGNPWRRWECAIPWSKDGAASRCKPVNV
jgi:hypothetical protein